MFIFLIQIVFGLTITSPYVKILQLTDLHYGESSESDKSVQNLQQKLLDWEKPDLSVITGDIVSGYAWPYTFNWYLKSYTKFISPFKATNTPWALILGNHDIEADLTGEEIMKIDAEEPLSLSKTIKNNLSHASNYYVPIVYKGKTQLIIWALDTGNRNHLEFGFDRVHEDQLNWIKLTQKILNQAEGYPIPGIIFMHIPPPEYMDVWPSSLGHKFENVSCPGNHSRYFLKSLENIIAVSVGHDHFNDYQGKFNDIELFYGRKTGYAGVGPEPYFERGARVFVYDFESNTLQNWIRDELGNKVTFDKKEGKFEHQSVCAESVEIKNNYSKMAVGIFFVIGMFGFLYLKKNKKKIERFNL